MKSKLQLAGMVLAAVPAVFAQSNEAPKKDVFFMQVPGPGPVEHTFDFVASEFSFDGKVVKNAPYSAEAVTETTQRLADGNRISTKMTSNLYRDSEGRTRREEKVGAIGPWSPNSEPLQTVFINDPVENTNIVLDSRNKVARKMPSPQIRFLPSAEGSAGVATGFAPATPAVAVAEMKGTFERHVSVRRGSGEPNVFFSGTSVQIPLNKDMEKNSRKESLGVQMIEGVRAEGSRTTFTIPAGSIGNDLPIEIVSERWYSPELQMVVMTKRNDPRMGETVYRLSNLSRSEPARTIFEAPADYSIEDLKPPFGETEGVRMIQKSRSKKD